MDISNVGDLNQQIARIGSSKVQPAADIGKNGQVAAAFDTQSVKPAEQDAPKKMQLDDSVKKMNDFVQNVERNLSFFVDDATGHDVVKVVERSTNELIRQFPSEEFLKISKNMNDMTGLLFKDQV